ncbi:MAG: dNTP triphosphohydrolase [Candidatus Sumerlaeota bacterium]|nr:dNTP triphosphohydrolase [Candidatus Sumerlaeota bacterium]
MDLYKPADCKRIKFEKRSRGDYRSPFRRDYARIIHSSPFRRLQGKTQLFMPGESDFFRNRLTHSLEVSQIATGIALMLNCSHKYFIDNNLDLDLVSAAAMAHDLGHPPFGHNGERALNACMKKHGGFEGNAKTLRILTRLAKKECLAKEETSDGSLQLVDDQDQDCRLGLNLTYRTLASILKYDRLLDPFQHKPKGFYYFEQDIVAAIKSHVAPKHGETLKTIECQIMDIADDIAYATHDLEDAFKGGYITPLRVFENNFIIHQIAKEMRENGQPLEAEAVKETLSEIFPFFNVKKTSKLGRTEYAIYVHVQSQKIASNGYFRTKFISKLVHKFVRQVRVRQIADNPALSILDWEGRTQVEILKKYVYLAITQTDRIKVSEYPGYEMIKYIFNALSNVPRGIQLLPDDYRSLYSSFRDENQKKRVICDFVANMTDEYAAEFHSRLTSSHAPKSLF